MSNFEPQDERPFVRSGYTSGQGRTPRGDRATYRVPTYSRVRSGEHRMHLGCLGITLLVLAVVAVLGYLFYNYAYGSEHHETFTITRLDDQSSGTSHKYLIFGRLADGTVKVYEDTDSLSHLKFNSSDLYGSLTVGEKVDCDLYGYRSHLFSGYQDLLSCQKVG